MLVLAVAIANPLCCCDAALFAGTPEETDKAGGHACCAAPVEADGQTLPRADEERQPTDSHDSANCPHQAGNGHLQATLDSARDVRTVGVPTDFAASPQTEAWRLPPPPYRNTKGAAVAAMGSAPPGPGSRQQLFCAYRL